MRGLCTGRDGLGRYGLGRGVVLPLALRAVPRGQAWLEERERPSLVRGWFPCLASRNRYARGNPAPPTPLPLCYVIAPNDQPLIHPPSRRLSTPNSLTRRLRETSMCISAFYFGDRFNFQGNRRNSVVGLEVRVHIFYSGFIILSIPHLKTHHDYFKSEPRFTRGACIRSESRENDFIKPQLDYKDYFRCSL